MNFQVVWRGDDAIEGTFCAHGHILYKLKKILLFLLNSEAIKTGLAQRWNVALITGVGRLHLAKKLPKILGWALIWRCGTYSNFYSTTYLLARWLLRLLSGSLPHSLTRFLTPSLPYLTYALTHSPTHLLIYLPTHVGVCSCYWWVEM